MRELELTKEELELLKDELIETKNLRSKEVKNGLLILSLSTVGAVAFWLLAEHFPIANKLLAIAFFGIALGPYKSYWWLMNKSIKLLEQDIHKKRKVQDESKIVAYRKRNHTVKLANGFRMNDFDIQHPNWKVGDNIAYEYTPTDKYVLNTQIIVKAE